MNHFKGKAALEHVVEARLKGRLASAEVHGTEPPGHVSAAADAAKETAVYLLILWTLMGSAAYWVLLVFVLALLLWKVGRSALLGWSRLERLHRLIEEERYEIEHHRAQEKEELRALYAAKGFSGKLLDEVIEVLMADDHRLLQVMLEEELGLNLETHEHPLKQAAGACIGVAGASLVMSFGVFALPMWGLPLCGAIVIMLSAGTSAQLEKNQIVPSIIWNLAVAALAILAAYFLAQLFL
ncbi:MAG: VIT1/CCC1 transporter family protein [Verrucomicrobia bacterium]|nr:VIT1/CCC1 transporter family protein [Verrucomicrobiota bacterium]MBU6446126.1 VIT1/CCC1 transporter family protein [Verrucomicrobiota bacterium]MDE3047014.1 VIT1/CCC1 transporter family protein [Verrucomicrobiota bacterium]